MLCGTPRLDPPPLSSPFSLSAAPPTELAPKTRPTRHSSTPSCRILPSAAAVFPLSGERPLSFAIPKLELNLSSPFHTGAAGPHTCRRRPSELPPHRRTPLSRAPLLPPRCPVVRVCATPTRLARRHPEESLVLSGCTSPPVSRRRTVGKHATAPSGWTGPWPSQLVGRPRVAGHHAPWAVASGRFQPGTVPGI
jgi:hypothetical protein